MPQLSIIVPLQNCVEQLESTLLAVLENRPYDCEVLVVHDGSYHDPYQLGRDEVVMIETDTGFSWTQQVNEGLRAATAPIVHVLQPGMQVQPDWTEEAVERFLDHDVAAVSLRIDSLADDTSAYGLEAGWLPRRSLARKLRVGREVFPLISGGFFRRRVLLAVDGFMEQLSTEAAEAEFGLAIHALEMRSEVVENVAITSQHSFETTHHTNYAAGFLAGQLANAYAQMEQSEVETGSFVARLSHLAGGLMSPSSVAERLGWVLGVKDRALVKTIESRISHASQSLAAWRAAKSTRPIVASRRAA